MLEDEKGKRLCTFADSFLLVGPQADLVTGKREVSLKYFDITHYFRDSPD